MEVVGGVSVIGAMRGMTIVGDSSMTPKLGWCCVMGMCNRHSFVLHEVNKMK